MKFVGVLGATSMIGAHVFNYLLNAEYQIIAFSREPQKVKSVEGLESRISWRILPHLEQSEARFSSNSNELENIEKWICLSPIWTLVEHFSLLEIYGATRVVALSSTSRFTKIASSDDSERRQALKLSEAEKRFKGWAKRKNVEWTILQTTMIYEIGKDQNITKLIQFIERFRFFPLLGKGEGRRQPIHANDVAKACYLALDSSNTINKSYILSGKEVLTYRKMVERLFEITRTKTCIISCPIFVFRMVVFMLSMVPRSKVPSLAMIERMNQDMVFEYHQAAEDFGFSPQSFLSDKMNREIVERY